MLLTCCLTPTRIQQCRAFSAGAARMRPEFVISRSDSSSRGACGSNWNCQRRSSRFCLRTRSRSTNSRVARCELQFRSFAAFHCVASGLVGARATAAAYECGAYQNFHGVRSEEHTSELQSHLNLVCRLLLEKKK